MLEKREAAMRERAAGMYQHKKVGMCRFYFLIVPPAYCAPVFFIAIF
jgi:hypothetical protein